MTETGTRLSRLHTRLRGLAVAQRFTLFVRGMLTLGFLAPGLTKVLGLDFAPGIDSATPMGGFFRAFHGTGFFYAFVGGVQVVASVLLLSRRTALLGACLYAPVIGSIWVLVTATRFSFGTQMVTGLMVLACLWLLIWDGHRLAPLFSPRAGVGERPVEPAAWDLLAPPWGMDRPAVSRLVRFGYILGLGGAVGLTLFSRGLAVRALAAPCALTVLAGVLLTLLAWGVAFTSARSPASPG